MRQVTVRPPETGQRRIVPAQTTVHVLQVLPGATIIDKHGAEHLMANEVALDEHPIFFERRDDGLISHVHHHPEEHEKSLRHKRALISYMQVLHRPLARSSHDEFQARETHTEGPVHTNYTVRAGVFRRLVYRS